MTRCRSHTLGNLVKNLSDKQKQAVVEVGFGGLLHLKLQTLCRKMLPWLVENFNGGSCMFTVASGKEFVVTKNDVCDVFSLPMGNILVPELNKSAEVASVDNCIIQAWRYDFDASDKQSIPLAKLESWMQELVDGGVAFKRKLKKSVDKYNKDLTVQSVNGCLLALQILYFHYLNFQGQKESCSLPLIQHWTYAKDPVAAFQTQQLLSDPHYHKLLDGIIEECMKMKSAHEFFQFDIPFARTHVEGCRQEDVPQDVLERGNNEDVPEPSNNQDVLEPRNNQDGNARIFDRLPQLQLEVLDYSLLKDKAMDRNENLVTFGMNCLVPREDMVSISSPLKIRWCIVDCYALYLNEVACFESSGPRRFFFGVRQSEGWVDYENHGCDILDSKLIYVPILIEEHYVLFVVDHAKQLIYYLDNIIWCDATLNYFQKFSLHMCDQLSDFLGKRNHLKSKQLPFYKFKVVDFQWKKTKIDNTECGVFVMYHMLHFIGELFI
uniref:Ubiquitin-like protease family profile domain-containing protein n=1 Tax=Chenopodium quinoa TaxID=63459 RepID=A0A803MAB0_CHEQI